MLTSIGLRLGQVRLGLLSRELERVNKLKFNRFKTELHELIINYDLNPNRIDILLSVTRQKSEVRLGWVRLGSKTGIRRIND